MSMWLKRILVGLTVTGLGLALAGCRTGGDDLSEQPWNKPKSWENGLPAALTEGR